MAREAAAEFELAPSLAVKVFVVLPIAELVETVPTVVEIALAAPEEFVAEAVPTAAAVALVDPVGIAVGVVPTVAASFGSVEVSVVVAEQQLARHGLCDRCEGAARYITPRVSPML